MARRNQPKSPPYRAPALEKGIAILELLAESGQPMTTAEVAATLKRSRAEIYRMFVVLESLEYILRTDDGGFDLSARMFDIASRHAPRRSVVTASRPFMEELSELTRQSCHLMVNSGDHMVCVAREESPAAIGFSVQVGFRPPMLQSTSGRVYFAFQDESRQDLLLKRLARGRRNSPALRDFREGAARVRRRGHAVEPSRLTDGIEDLSAPIFASDQRAIACLNIPFVSHRLFPVTREQAVSFLLKAAQRISKSLEAGGR